MTMANSIISYDRDVGQTVMSFGPIFPTISQVEYALCIHPPKYPVPAIPLSVNWFTEYKEYPAAVVIEAWNRDPDGEVVSFIEAET